MPDAKIVTLPGVGQALGTRSWRRSCSTRFAELARPAPSGAPRAGLVADLPLIEIPAEGAPPMCSRWCFPATAAGPASIARSRGALAKQGVAVVGFDSLQYFWTRRTPDESAQALARVVSHYADAWHKPRVALIGYSRGADVLPFMASRLPPELRARVSLIALLGPARSVEFEFHLTDWLGGGSDADALPTAPEVAKLRGSKVLCLYGSGESDSLCPDLDPALAERVERPGDHHFGGDYQALAARILAALGRP